MKTVMERKGVHKLSPVKQSQIGLMILMVLVFLTVWGASLYLLINSPA